MRLFIICLIFLNLLFGYRDSEVSTFYSGIKRIPEKILFNISNDSTDMIIEGSTEALAMPVAVSSASTLGVTASTGTAISSLNGAAAVSATSYAVGSAVIEGAAIVGLSIPAAPAVVGGVVITAAGLAAGKIISWGVKKIFSDK
jgi:hypothetical protein